MIYWMSNTGHDNTGCYTCHDWVTLKDFAGTIETINGGWGGGEAPLTNNGGAKQLNRITFFRQACKQLGLDPEADGWNGLATTDLCPCERYFPEMDPDAPAITSWPDANSQTDGNYCRTSYPDGSCKEAATTLPAGYPFCVNECGGGSLAVNGVTTPFQVVVLVVCLLFSIVW